jgi:hypothetical protein
MIWSDITWQRLHNQRLLGAPFATAEDAVAWFGAVQAQDYSGAKWAIGQRIRQCADAAVEQVFQSGRIVRTHVLRPTWHFVMPADIRWMLELTAPRIRALMAPYDRKLELDAKLVRRSNSALGRALRGNHHLTREELAAVLGAAGIVARGQRLGHLMMHAELDCVILSGPRRGKQFTYALFDERVPAQKPKSRDQALAELTKRYFQSHGPALLRDFAWWSGLKVSDAKAGVEMVTPRLETQEIAGKTYWFAPFEPRPKPTKPCVHLLPNYDEYLISYKDYTPAIDAKLFAGLGPTEKGMLFSHLVVSNGHVVGGWRRTIERDSVSVEIKLRTTLKRPERIELERAGKRFAKFLDVPVRISSTRAF